MPFVYDDGSPVDHVDLRQVTQKRFQLMRGFVYMEPGTKVSVPVPKHDLGAPPDGANGTDLASVPPVLQGLVASYGLHTRSALMHDKLCEDAKSVPGKWAAFRVRKEADRLFRVALEESEVPWLRRWLMWAAVSVGRYFSHVRPLGYLLALHLLVSVAAVAAALFLPGWWPLVVLGVFAGSVFWLRDAGVVAIGCVAAPLVFPLIVVGVVTGALVAFPWKYWIWKLAT